MSAQHPRPRRLPFTEGGRRAYVISEPGGILQREADAAEARMLDDARALLTILSKTVGELETRDEFDFVVQRMSEALTNAIGVADARGERLGEH